MGKVSKKRAVLDTNVLLSYPEAINEFDIVIIPVHICEELDGLKKADGLLGWQAREALRRIDAATNVKKDIVDIYDIDVYGWDETKRDNQIVFCAKVNNAIMVSNDTAVRIKAEHLGLKTQAYERSRNDAYSGFVEIEMSNEELADWYSTKNKENKWGVLCNQYMMIKNTNTNEIVDCWVCMENGFRGLKTQIIESAYLGKLKPKDVYQTSVIDSLCNNQLTMIKGRAGSGKSLLSLSYSLSMIEQQIYSKLIIFCNTVPVKNSQRLGFYKGTRDEKLLDSQIGTMLTSKLGDRSEVENFIKSGKILLLPMSDIRGFDTTGMNAIVWITEAQNLDIELMRLAIQRIGADCQLILDGDCDTQIDVTSFEGDKNGMKRVSEVFRGEKCYGEMELNVIYRSELAKIADKL